MTDKATSSVIGKGAITNANLSAQDLYRRGVIHDISNAEESPAKMSVHDTVAQSTPREDVIYDTVAPQETSSKNNGTSPELYKDSFPKDGVYDTVAAKGYGAYSKEAIYDTVAECAHPFELMQIIAARAYYFWEHHVLTDILVLFLISIAGCGQK
ncbi:unnamed protein product [Strongylus vulgaris]|uniref:Uncharacterized protein n=1 Tax=Strongylus vulgaris TaxID=40348 RepID=A0A3P7JTZ5_STRVU|nr:unnamed protein product [Strongylus vulgaris]